jgi:predicted nuclease with TOPRIM domain
MDLLPDAITLIQTIGIFGISIFIIIKLLSYILKRELSELKEMIENSKKAFDSINSLEEFISDPQIRDGKTIPMARLYNLLEKHNHQVEENLKYYENRINDLEDIIKTRCDGEGCPANAKMSGVFKVIDTISKDLSAFTFEARESRARTMELIKEIGESINKFIADFGLKLIDIVRSTIRKD